ncbi:MAG: acyloxyacyl hydrolase [Dysgonamonadaceae bacterium]|jgi:hypothetical protein|nr:acyloxyacyl hydrolase [Dysgonamonadaceae bacterium]
MKKSTLEIHNNKLMGRLLVILCFLLCAFSVHAQLINKRNMVIESRWFQGDLKKPDPHLQSILQTGTVRAYDLRLGFTDSDSSYFAISSRHPTFGVGFSMVDYSRARMVDEPRNIGNLYSLYGYIDRTLFQFKSIGLSYNLDSGIAYNTDTYDSISRPNKIFSSVPLMIYIGAGLNLKCRLSDHFGIGVSAGAKHFSNGRMGIWNKGMNILGGDVSLRYYYSPPAKNRPHTVSSDFDKHFYWHLLAGGGIQTYLEDLQLDGFNARNRRYPIYAKYFMSTDVLYCLSRRYACGLGMDLFYIPSVESFRKADEYDLKKAKKDAISGIRYDHFSAGIAINQELYYRNLAVTASIGHYLYRELGMRENEKPIYQRFGCRYYFPHKSNLFVGFSIKAHSFQKAEYFEFSIGKFGILK